MSMLRRKLWRDLSELRGQVITIALVVASGIGSFVAMRSTWASLERSKRSCYEEQQFADVFAHLERAPLSVAERIGAIDGVYRVVPRVVESVKLPLSEPGESAVGNLVSLPASDQTTLNRVQLKHGRLPERSGEVVLLQTFADAHGLRPGQSVQAVINGRLRRLAVVGTGMSPEYLFAIPPGAMTVDEKRFAVLWMSEADVAAAYEMAGAFNDVTVQLWPSANREAVLGAIDRLLVDYGGAGALPQDKQMSNQALSGELAQLGVMATVLPAIFLGVAAFLLNVVLSRLVRLQRSQIATLKAVGYSDRAIAAHYLNLVVVIVLAGAVLGVVLGLWGGRSFTLYYGNFFKFPQLSYHLGPDLILSSVAISLGAALIGTLATAWHVSSLPPAEAMRPAPPASYRRTLLERLGLYSLLTPGARMVAREVERRPLRTLVSSVGIAMAVGIVVLARFWSDAVDHLVDVQFARSMREDFSVVFTQRQPERVIGSLAALPGVQAVEGLSVVSARFRGGHHYRDAALWGYPSGMQLRSVLEATGQSAAIPESGVLLTKKLAEILELEPGDEVEVELREGQRQSRRVRVASVVDESFGLQGHMTHASLSALQGEQGSWSMALLKVDPALAGEVRRRLSDMPAVASVTRRDNLRERFEEQNGAAMLVFTLIATLCAACIAIGVVYNNARIALAARSRDLASLRVLGFTRAEISAILIGELSVQVILAIPVGLVVGTWLAHGMMATTDPETYRFMVTISAKTYAFAALVTIVSGLVSALLVRRQLDRLDLIGVLKTRE